MAKWAWYCSSSARVITKDAVAAVFELPIQVKGHLGELGFQVDHAVAHLDHQHAILFQEVGGIGQQTFGELEAVGARRQASSGSWRNSSGRSDMSSEST